MSFDAISPVDGRYAAETRPLARYFSERAFASERVAVELGYLSLLVRLGVAPKRRVPKVAFSMERVKRLEEELGHDVKATEVFVRESVGRAGAEDLAPFVHLGLTSEDVNSVAFARLLSAGLSKVLVPAYAGLATSLAELAHREARTPMLARTHGQPAVPTTFGKEVAVFAYRIAERTAALAALRPMAKFAGAVGTYASFELMSRLDWRKELASFLDGMGVEAALYSTQVVPGERLSDILHCAVNLNQLMLSLARDLWLYQALGYVRFVRPGKVSSSTMPQKVNPVDVENAEGQSEVSTSLLTMIAYRLQTTRLQRDLSDSVVRRMVGQGLAHSLVAAGRLSSSLASMSVERGAMKRDLDSHPEVYAEAAQVRLRLGGDAKGYEKVKRAVETGSFAGTVPAGGYVGLAPELALECRRAVASLLRPTS